MIQNDIAQQAKKYYVAQKSKENNAPDDDNRLRASREFTETHNARASHFQDTVSLDKNKNTNTYKVADLETPSFCSNREGSHYQGNNTSKRAYAAKHATKQQHGTSSRLPTNSMAAGTAVFLKSLKSQSKKVAVATVQSCDPTQKLDGVDIGNQFLLVRVSIIIADDEVLVRPYKNYKFMGDALGAHIAWPATLIEKANW
ncbi:uncharacterized protein LOC133910023 isoform X1 [Phragmites australis]|uniref:uncharacterized protein LOC133910023 isoform X1 n=1 Tax=Phragmites australis TaxID=29695 RepID=UPI002D76CBE7|nr:uncharacterized protein LOC133910023 isoform X1 [Phragmites australis]